VPGRLTYDLLYRAGGASAARGWDRGAGPELVDLLVSGRVTPGALPHGRAVDLGCGTGGNVMFLAAHGFDAVGVDFSGPAIAMASEQAAGRDLAERARFVRGDVTADQIIGAEGPFDLVVVYNTLQDLRGRARRSLARTIHRLVRPGGQVVLWCYYAEPRDLPIYSFRGASRLLPFVVSPGEEVTLFGEAFDIERLPEPGPASGSACFLLTRVVDAT
jgi:SAM-dependent methyltransferase